MESAAQNVILSLLLEYVVSKEAVEISEAEECQPLLDALQLSAIPSVSIRLKSIISVLERKTGSQPNFTQIELTSVELEFIAECLFEIAASKLQWYLGFSSTEILQVYQQVIASSPTNMQAFQAFNVLSDDDFMEVQVSAEIHAVQLQSNVAVVGNTSNGTGKVSLWLYVSGWSNLFCLFSGVTLQQQFWCRSTLLIVHKVLIKALVCLVLCHYACWNSWAFNSIVSSSPAHTGQWSAR